MTIKKTVQMIALGGILATSVSDYAMARFRGGGSFKGSTTKSSPTQSSPTQSKSSKSNWDPATNPWVSSFLGYSLGYIMGYSWAGTAPAHSFTKDELSEIQKNMPASASEEHGKALKDAIEANDFVISFQEMIDEGENVEENKKSKAYWLEKKTLADKKLAEFYSQY